MSKSNIGIEIGSSEVTMAQLTGKTAKIAVERMPENLVQDNRIVSPVLLQKFLKEMRRKGGFSGSACSVILPEYSTYFRTLSMPVVSESQLKLNLPYEFRDFVGAESVNYFYDYAMENTLTDENGEPTTLEMDASAAQKSVVAEYIDIMRRAGMKLKIALPREMALINLARSFNANGADKEKEYCLVDIGFDATRVYIFANGRLRASKIIDVGCRQVDEAIASTINIDAYLAASYRETNHNGILEDMSCTTVYEQIALEIMKAINFYKYENQQSAINDVFFCGSGAGIERLVTEVIGYIQFERRDIREFLPPVCRDYEDAYRCALTIGATL